jgi:hypothetical protein
VLPRPGSTRTRLERRDRLGARASAVGQGPAEGSAAATYGPVDREGTGPLLLERIRHEVDGVTLFEPNVFYATEREQAEYAFHLSARSWKDEAGLRSDLARAERDRAIAREELRKLRSASTASSEAARCGGS